jgi:hypothetical protein
MENDYLGYLLNAIEPHARRELEADLGTNPEAQVCLESVRQALAPLALDRSLDPPPGLAQRTLAHVFASPAAAAMAASLEPRIPRFSWPGRRMLELAVAAVCLLTITGLGAVWIARMRGHFTVEPGAVQMVECKSNLQKLMLPLRSFADLHHGEFPNVAAAAASPRNVVALVFPMMQEAKLLTAEAKLGCPLACSSTRPASLGEIKAMDSDAFLAWADGMQHSYAYSLGYRSNDKIVGMRLDQGKPTSMMPVMADSPPADALRGNSLDHNGKGQHVLYADGHVTFCPTRDVGFQQDDIYLNRAHKVAAGVDWSDTVLASGRVTP